LFFGRLILFAYAEPYQKPHQVPKVRNLWCYRKMQAREFGKIDLYVC